MSRGKHVSNFPIGAMGIAGKAGTHPSLVEQERIPIEQQESNWAIMSARHFSHRGNGKFSSSLWHVQAVVDRSVCSCASVSRGKHISISLMGQWEIHIGGWGFAGVAGAYSCLVEPKIDPN